MESASRSVSLSFPAEAEYVALGRVVLEGLERARKIEAGVVADLKLAVTEACGNVVKHAYDGEAGLVEVRFEVAEAEVVVEVVDAGRGFDLDSVGSPESLLAEEGRGLAIIGTVAEDLEVRRGPDGRGACVRFRRRLKS